MTEQSENLELEVIVNDEPLLKEVTFNYEQLKDSLKVKLKKYDELVVSEESIKSAKTDRAFLNKLDGALMVKGQEIDEKILGLFKTRLKELRGLVKNAKDSIDYQVKDLENKEKEHKQSLIKLFYDENIGDLKELLSINSIFKATWLNKTVTLKSIETELKQIIDTVRKDLTVINTLDSEFSLQVKDYYLRTRDLSGALAEKARLEDAKKKIAELDKKEVVFPIPTEVQKEIEDEKTHIDNMDWANVSAKPKETSLKITCNDAQLELLKVFLDMHKIKFEEVK